MQDQESQAEAANTRRIVVLSAPSGAGKTTIAHRLLDHHPRWRFSVSATTRQQRPGERDGLDYHFLSIPEFQRRIAHGDLVEWEEIFGNLYGTLRSETEALIASADVDRVVFDVDVKGALAIRQAFPRDAYLVFIAPPSMDELVRRLEMRRTESPESLRIRISRAHMEMGRRDEFDAIVVNDEVERATKEIETLLGQ